MMPSFLDLPLEIRDNIVQITLSLHQSAPACPKSLKTDDRVEFNDFESSVSQPSKPVNKYEISSFVPAVLPLLLVNHQLQTEVLRTLSRCSSKHDYVLDVKIVDDVEVWPTWLSVPVLTTRVNNVRAKVQFSYTEDIPRTPVSKFIVGKGGNDSLAWNFYSIFERFLMYGPVGLRTKEEDKYISINTLEIDVIPPEDVHSYRIIEARAIEDDEIDDDDWEYVSQGHLLGYVAHILGRAINMSNDVAEYGALLYERIGSISLFMNGCPISGWDLANILRALNPPDAEDGPLGDFKAWKETVQRKRRDMGLRVAPPRKK